MYDQRLHAAALLRAVTDSKHSKETVVSTHCSTTTDRGTDQMESVSMKCSKSHGKKKLSKIKVQCGS